MPQYAVLKTVVWDGAEWAGKLQGPWQELAAACPVATPFQTWEWQSLWFRHFGGSKSPHVWTQYDGADLVGLYPMVRASGIWRSLRPMGCGPSDYLQPIMRPGYEGRVAEALAGYLCGLPQVDLVDLHQLRETQELAVIHAGTSHDGGLVLGQAACLVLDLPHKYDDYVASLSKSLRYDVRRLDKLAGAGGSVVVESPDPHDAQAVQAAMDVLFDCHKRRWRKRGLPGAFLGSKTQRFHYHWAETAARNDWMRVSLLRFDGRYVGAIYAMAFGKTAYFYQSGFDPVQGSISPGTLLVAHTIRQAIEEGRTSFDFMRGDEPYKRRWKPQHTFRNLRVLVAAKGWRGRSASAWNSAGFRIESRLRARLEGRGLI